MGSGDQAGSANHRADSRSVFVDHDGAGNCIFAFDFDVRKHGICREFHPRSSALFLGSDGGSAAKVIGVSIDIVFSTAVVTVLFAAIFKLLPDVKIAWNDVWLGAFVTTVLFQIGKYGLSLYLSKASPTSAYGAAGSMVAVLLWVYYSSQILYFGAEFTQVYANQFGTRIVPSDNAQPLTEQKREQQGIPHRCRDEDRTKQQPKIIPRKFASAESNAGREIVRVAISASFYGCSRRKIFLEAAL